MSTLIYGVVVPAKELFNAIGLLAPLVDKWLKEQGKSRKNLKASLLQDFEHDALYELIAETNSFSDPALKGLSIFPLFLDDEVLLDTLGLELVNSFSDDDAKVKVIDHGEKYVAVGVLVTKHGKDTLVIKDANAFISAETKFTKTSKLKTYSKIKKLAVSPPVFMNVSN